jgi:hypothetical protein
MASPPQHQLRPLARRARDLQRNDSQTLRNVRPVPVGEARRVDLSAPHMTQRKVALLRVPRGRSSQPSALRAADGSAGPAFEAPATSPVAARGRRRRSTGTARQRPPSTSARPRRWRPSLASSTRSHGCMRQFTRRWLQAHLQLTNSRQSQVSGPRPVLCTAAYLCATNAAITSSSARDHASPRLLSRRATKDSIRLGPL